MVSHGVVLVYFFFISVVNLAHILYDAEGGEMNFEAALFVLSQ